MCLLFFTIFKTKMYFFVISNEIYWKEILLTVVLSSHRFMNIHSRLSYQALPTFLKLLVLKKELHVESRQCSWRRHFPRWKNHKEKWTNKPSTNQDKHRENCSNLFKWFKKLSYQGFKIRLVILKVLGKCWYILNK